jgi:hypothetical protein
MPPNSTQAINTAICAGIGRFRLPKNCDSVEVVCLPQPFHELLLIETDQQQKRGLKLRYERESGRGICSDC